MELTRLQVARRAELGKGACARLRAQGAVPGVFYSPSGENIPVVVDAKALAKAFEAVRYSKPLAMALEDGTERPVLIKELKAHPFKRAYVHVDFWGIDLEKTVDVTVPVAVVGRSKGVVLGGKLAVYRETVTVRCLPHLIPDVITVDVTEMNIGDKLMVDQLPVPEGVQVLFDRSFAVLAITGGRGAKEEAA
ncbi:MAG: 50S ribosomal protein L25 [Desulfomicrobiaceae bacterium]